MSHNTEQQTVKLLENQLTKPPKSRTQRNTQGRRRRVSELMAMASSSLRHPLRQTSFPKCPHLPHNSQLRTRLRFSSLRFPSSTIRASPAVALEPVIPSYSLLLSLHLFQKYKFNYLINTLKI